MRDPNAKTMINYKLVEEMRNRDGESPEAKQTDQEDPIVMYLIVRESLNMSIGKTAAQCAHASQTITMYYFEYKDKSRALQKKILETSDPDEVHVMKALYAEQSRKISIFGEWMNSNVRKVVLKADDKEWKKVQDEFGNYMILITDAGYTEVEPGSETCIGLWPMRKSQAPKTIKRLQVLK